MKFNNNTYIPVLRWKPAEMKAYQQLSFKQKEAIFPLIEIINDNKISSDITKTFFNKPFFIDFTNLYKKNTKIKNNTLTKLTKCLKANQNNFIITINFEEDANLIFEIKEFAHDYDIKEFAFRIPSLLPSLYINRKINEFINYFNIKIEDTHLLIDHQAKYENFVTPTILEMTKLIPNIEKWKTFCVIGSSFPKDLSNLEKNNIHYIPRLEWLKFTNEVEQKLNRIPYYGDYTIQYGLYNEPPKNCDFSASIRYTLEDAWKIMRGESAKTYGFDQYPAQAQFLISDEKEFLGIGYSAGDKYIYDMAVQNTNPGNAGTWLQAGINHHMVFVNNQLSTYF